MTSIQRIPWPFETSCGHGGMIDCVGGWLYALVYCVKCFPPAFVLQVLPLHHRMGLLVFEMQFPPIFWISHWTGDVFLRWQSSARDIDCRQIVTRRYSFWILLAPKLQFFLNPFSLRVPLSQKDPILDLILTSEFSSVLEPYCYSSFWKILMYS